MMALRAMSGGPLIRGTQASDGANQEAEGLPALPAPLDPSWRRVFAGNRGQVGAPQRPVEQGGHAGLGRRWMATASRCWGPSTPSTYSFR